MPFSWAPHSWGMREIKYALQRLLQAASAVRLAWASHTCDCAADYTGYISSMVGTLYAAMVIHSYLLSIVFSGAQVC